MNPFALFIWTKWKFKMFWRRNWKVLVGLLFVGILVSFVPSMQTAITAAAPRKLMTALGATAPLNVLDFDKSTLSQQYSALIGTASTKNSSLYIAIPSGFGDNLSTNQSATILVFGYDAEDVKTATTSFYRQQSRLGDIDIIHTADTLAVAMVLIVLTSIVGSGIASGKREGLFPYTNNFLDARIVVAFESAFLFAIVAALVAVGLLPIRALLASIVALIVTVALNANLNPRSWVAENSTVVWMMVFFVAKEYAAEPLFQYLPLINFVSNIAPQWLLLLTNIPIAVISVLLLKHQRFIE